MNMYISSTVKAIQRNAELFPDKACLIEAKTGKQLTYSEFWNKSCLFATKLKDRGLKKGNRVVLRVGGFLESVTAQFGIYLAGGIHCPVEKNIKELALVKMLEYYKTDFLVSAMPVSQELNWFDLSLLCKAYSDNNEYKDIDIYNQDGLCSITFTTGTTGKAKGVVMSRKAIALYLEARRKAFGFNENDVYMLVTPIDKLNAWGNSLLMLFSGGTAVHFDGIVFINDFFSAIKRYNVTALFLQSFAVNMLLNSGVELLRECANQLRIISIGGSAFSDVSREHLKETLPATRLFIQYSSTETLVITYYEYSAHTSKPNCVGKPYPGVTVRILDNDGKPMQSSRENWGRIECESDMVMSGYWDDADLTNSVLNKNKILMTDIGYIDDDGFLYVLGRSDDIIVSGGHKIAPYEIEELTKKLPGVSEAVCLPMPDDVLGSVPKLFIETKEGQELSVKEVYGYLSERLETYKLPKAINQVKSFPTVPGSSKINRKELLKYD